MHFGFLAATVVAAPLGTEPGGGIELRNLLAQTLVPDDHYVEGHDAVDIGIRSNDYLQSKVGGCPMACFMDLPGCVREHPASTDAAASVESAS